MRKIWKSYCRSDNGHEFSKVVVSSSTGEETTFTSYSRQESRGRSSSSSHSSASSSVFSGAAQGLSGTAKATATGRNERVTLKIHRPN